MRKVMWIPVLLMLTLALVFTGCPSSKDACKPDPCSGHGTCTTVSSNPVCACQAGYSGDNCSTCAVGYQDNDKNGTCSATCPYSAISCGDHGQCDDSGGAAACKCETGYQGDTCSACAAGYQDKDKNGICLPDCTTAGSYCGAHGTCNDSSGKVTCVCATGYIGDHCEGCDQGYQDNDKNGTCLPTCVTSALDCGSHGYCSDASGTASCVCQATYAGVHCENCDTGYQDNDHNGICLPDCAAANLDCKGHGSCTDVSGTASCICQTGYTGADCGTCDAGYQDNDHNGTCMPTCAGVALDCGVHGRCVDNSGVAECKCDTGYMGTACQSCAAGYNNFGGTCYPSCQTAGYTCSGLGTCDDSAGMPKCNCNIGFFDDGHGHCVPPNGHTCATALPLDLSAGTVSATTTGSGNDYSCNCQPFNGAEMVYSFTVNQKVHVHFLMTGFDSVLYVRTDCANQASEIACDDDSGGNGNAAINRDFDPGTYYLFCDGHGSASGPFTLTIDVSCPAGTIFDPGSGTCVPNPCTNPSNPCTQAHKTQCQPVPPTGYVCSCDPGYIPDPAHPDNCILNPNPQGDTCADAIPLAIGDGSVNGDNTAAHDDYQGSCAGNGPERVYVFSTTARTRVDVLMTGYDTVLYMRSICDSPQSEVACNDDLQGNNAGFTQIVDPGTYYLFADSYSDPGTYTLQYSLRPDPCANEEAVCPGTPVCQASNDWSSYTCVCPAGTVPYNGDCIDDPCDPNLCTQQYKTKCVPNLPGNYTCECNVGYIPDPQNPSNCIMDPNANDWAFFVFLNADNNLESFGDLNVTQMETAGSNPYVHIVALLDKSSDYLHAKDILILPGTYQVLVDLGEVNMSDWHKLAEFGVWAVQNYPARHVAFDMWDHGSGWKAKPNRPPFKGFSNDEHSGGEISVSNGDYASALAAIKTALGRNIDIVGFDACLMGMWEVGEASAPYADMLVASEETIPGAGWAYDAFLVPLVNNHTMLAPDFAKSIVDTYYSADSGNSTLSAVNLGESANLATAVSNLANAMLAHTSLYNSIETVRSAAQTFYISDYVDLWDFAVRIKAMAGVTSDITTAADALIAQLGVSIIDSKAQSDHPGAHGMSIYFPSKGSGMDPAYQDTGAVWSANATWDEFLASFLQ